MIYSLLRPILFSLDPEQAHEFTLFSLAKANKLGLASKPRITCQPISKMGLTFPNPVGLAPGMDKNGDCIDGLAALGFGFLELGTVTPRPQAGNPKPRLFRLPEVNGVINRMGFNNNGVDNLIRNIQKSKFFAEGGIIGINIGKNFDTPIERAVDDYLICLRRAFPYASYITINISSPNTKNLRQLQEGHELQNLLTSIQQERERLTIEHARHVPVALKIAPDLETEQIEHIAQLVLNLGIDALIATNTTISRDEIQGHPLAREAGGLSGGPVFEKSTAVLQQFAHKLQGKTTLIGVGGIDTAERAIAKLKAGADLVQIYSGMVFKGPDLITDSIKACSQFLVSKSY